MRVKGLTQPAANSGKGLEIAYDSAGSLAYIQSYDRAGAGSYTSLNINASAVAFNCAVTGTSFAGITGLAGTGSATTAAKSDHTHTYGVVTGTSFNGVTGLSSTTPLVAATTAVIGNETSAARANHVHPAQTTINGYKCFGGAGTSDGSGNFSITFPAPFSGDATFGVSAISTTNIYVVVTAASASGVTFQTQTRAAGTGTSAGIRWTAVGT